MIGKLLTVGAFAVLFVFFLSGCGRDSDHVQGNGHGSHDSVDAHASDDRETAHFHVNGAFSHYLAVQETLAADSLDGVSDHAAKLAEKLSDSEAVAAARAIAETDDIETARRHFETVSNALLADLRKHGSREGTLYEAYCPMAFDNRGASWVQADTTVNNPYYGSRMLRCGEIRETFAEENGDEHAHHHDHGHATAPGIDELPEGARTIKVLGGEYSFEPADITVAPGEVFALELENVGQEVHMWEIEGRPETHVHAEVGQTAVGVIVAPDEPGEYRIVCTEPGHTEAGMVGKLIVVEGYSSDAGETAPAHEHSH